MTQVCTNEVIEWAKDFLQQAESELTTDEKKNRKNLHH